MKNLQRLSLFILAAVLTVSFGFAATASAKMVKRVDNFIFFLDQSGSMAMNHKTVGTPKIDLSVDAMAAMNKQVPAQLDYTSALFLFAPFEGVVQPGAHNSAAYDAAIGKINKDFDIFGRRTAMGNGLMDIDPVIAGLSGRTALIIFTDGYSNLGPSPVAQAKALYSKYGSNLCIHVVSAADTAQGQMIIDEIRALSSCSEPAKVCALLKPGAMAAYAQKVFYEIVPDAPAPAPAPVIEEEKETISFALNFGFDKSAILEAMVPVLEQANMILEEDPNTKYEIAGYTDSTGPAAYNMLLSKKRAASVKAWLIAAGVPADRLEAVGYGESNPKYDNGTKEGRKLNRRVEINAK